MQISIFVMVMWQIFGTLRDTTRPHLHFDGLPSKSRRSVVSGLFGCVTIKYYRKKNSRFGLAWSRPRADRGLSRPTSVFRITVGVCKILSRSVELWHAVRGPKTCFWVKTDDQALCFITLAVNKLWEHWTQHNKATLSQLQLRLFNTQSDILISKTKTKTRMITNTEIMA